jgi:hypothetical protein
MATITPVVYNILETEKNDANKIYDGYHKHCIEQLTGNIYGHGVNVDVKKELQKLAPTKTKAYEEATAKKEALDTEIKTAAAAALLDATGDNHKEALKTLIAAIKTFKGEETIGGSKRGGSKKRRGKSKRRGSKRRGSKRRKY